MKILGLTPSNNFNKETPEQMYLRFLSSIGHEVMIYDSVIGNQLDFIPDVVVSMSEVTCEEGYKVAKILNVPFYAHMEWLPPWRIGFENPKNWGFDYFDFPKHFVNSFVNKYSIYTSFWKKADCKTLAGKCFFNDMKKFLGKEISIDTKYIGVDDKKLIKISKDYDLNNKQDEITCIARFVPHKRLHHVIEALKLINYKGVLNLVGYGNLLSFYESIKGSLNIHYYSSDKKYNCLSRSKLSIALWSGLVPLESMFFKTPCITYDSPYMKELYDDTLVYAKNNDIKDLAEQIKRVLNFSSKKRIKHCNYCINKVFSGKINTLDIDSSVSLLNNLIFKAVENFNKKKVGYL